MLVSTRGYEFKVHQGGPDQGPVVLLLHGFPQNSQQWGGVVPLLHGAGLRTIAVDQRGYSTGARPTEPEEYAVDECVTDALSIMDALNVRSFHVVGHDWGAVVAWALAADHPGRVLSLTAISVAHPSAFARAIAGGGDQRQKSEYMGFFAQLDKSEPALLANDAQVLRGLFAGSGLSDEEADKYVRPLLAPGALRAALSWYAALTLRPLKPYPPVTVPTTFIWGADDLALGREQAEACGGFVSGDYRYVPLEKISHWVPDQAPEAVGKEIVARCLAQ
ncbi:MAG TPA: alpha/beta hydrolase [Candidatus Limnocylindrales bacterium]|nr:alpha/beta hydrolase [Candidatus Limnocylindrales bacterium]